MPNSLTNKGPASLGPNATVGDLTVTGTLTVSGAVDINVPAGNTCRIKRGSTEITLNNGSISIKPAGTERISITDGTVSIGNILNVTGSQIQFQGTRIVDAGPKVWYAVAN